MGATCVRGSRCRDGGAQRGFTLIELLVVIAIIGVLVAVLIPSLSGARAQGMSVKCKANLQQIGLGLVTYMDSNDGFVVPSYNLPSASSNNVTGGPNQPLDGWGPILDRDKFVPSFGQDSHTVFYCPKTINVEGVAKGQTGTDPDHPRGWTDWPMIFTMVGGDSSPKQAVTIPDRGFNKIVRVSYWLNAYNPIGSAPSDIPSQDVYYTGSVGLGPDAGGNYIQCRKMISPRPSEFIVVSDGLYMGRQTVTRIGDANSRIGYRHPGMDQLEGMANTAFADGHVEPILGNKFPRALSSSDSPALAAEKRGENLGGPTVYSNARKVFGL